MNPQAQSLSRINAATAHWVIILPLNYSVMMRQVELRSQNRRLVLILTAILVTLIAITVITVLLKN
jgi:hypothetical protein